ncbi:MAG: DUF4214 domain-containing protein [Acidimicrobiales bacterium]|nr:DUF4214 domain-containing protein [Acidimicrobiales bacterium]
MATRSGGNRHRDPVGGASRPDRRLRRSILALAAALAAAALPTIAGASTGPGGATTSGAWATTAVTEVAPWVDGSGRLHGAWVDGPSFPTATPRSLQLSRLTAAGAPDESFGPGGRRSFAMETPPAVAPCDGVDPPGAVSITPSGEVLVGLYRSPLVDNACLDQPILERYSLDGVRLSRVDVGAPGQRWVGAGTDGLLALARLEVADDFHLIGSGGGVVASPSYAPLNAISLDQVPGGPLYLTTVGLFDGAVSVRRVTGASPGVVHTGTCGSGIGSGATSVRVLPSTGDTFAVACLQGTAYPPGSASTPGTLTIDHVGPSSWTRTLTEAFGTLGAGFAVGDGRVVVSGATCALGTCDGSADLARFDGTSAVAKGIETGAWDLQRVVPMGADGAGWTAFDTDGEFVAFATVDRGAFGGSSTPTAPAAPAKPTAVPASGQVTLSWSAPADGGSAITGYRIVPYRNGVAQAPIDVGTATSKAITGLTDGASYRFTVAARNSVGLGPASDLSDAVVPAGLPGAPRNVAAAAGNRSATVTWLPPASDGGSPITGYRVRAYADGAFLQDLTVGTATSTVVPDLKPGTIYRFEVIATNAIGDGPWSASSASITPPPAAFNSWNQMVDRQYRDLLDRPATAAEQSIWSNALAPGGQPSGTLPAWLRDTADNTGSVDPVIRLYSAYLDRTPDVGGLRYWIGRKRRGMRLTAISSNFATSSEFVRTYGSLSNRAFVELIYENVLDRGGDANGIAYWTRQLDLRRKTRGQVMVGFSESSEYIRLTASNVEVIALVTFLLGRAPTAEELDLGAQALAGGATIAELATEILDSDEYTARIGGL